MPLRGCMRYWRRTELPRKKSWKSLRECKPTKERKTLRRPTVNESQKGTGSRLQDFIGGGPARVQCFTAVDEVREHHGFSNTRNLLRDSQTLPHADVGAPRRRRRLRARGSCSFRTA